MGVLEVNTIGVAIRAWPTIPVSVQSSGSMSVSIAGWQLGICPGARRAMVPGYVMRSLSSRGVGLPGMTKKE